MQITTTTRTIRRNWDCPKCGGTLWWDDETTWIKTKKVGRRHWWNVKGPCLDRCPDGEHMHITDTCFSGCGFSQTRTEPVKEAS